MFEALISFSVLIVGRLENEFIFRLTCTNVFRLLIRTVHQRGFGEGEERVEVAVDDE